MRTFEFLFTVSCIGQGEENIARVEEMIDLHMQELVMDDTFIEALDEREAVTIQVTRLAK